MLNSKDKLPEAEGLGVIVARFQTPYLTDGHLDLIQTVLQNHKKVLIILGVNPTNTSTKKNPLDFITRKIMVESYLHSDNVYIVPLKDCRTDSEWSRNLDDLVSNHIKFDGKATLYCGRDGFKPYYRGKFDVVEIEPKTDISATEVRNSIDDNCDKSLNDFRKGVIWATQNRFPATYPVVDVAIFDGMGRKKILLGRKPGEELWRFVGGFVDPKKGLHSYALEYTVSREVFEEASVEVGEIKYFGSYFINDWRYSGEEDSVMSVLFTCVHTEGTPEGADDIEEVKWFPFNSETLNKIGPNAHGLMFKDLIRKFGSK